MITNNKKPPRIAEYLLKILMPDNFGKSGPGDFEEVYHAIASEKGLLRAFIWYWGQIFYSLPIFLKEFFIHSFTMSRSYVKISSRILWKQKLYSSINVFCLTIGITALTLLALFIHDELTYDTYHQNHNRIFRIATKYMLSTVNLTSASPNPVAPAMKDDFPEVENFFRIFKYNLKGSVVKAGQIESFEEKFYFADPSIFEVLTFESIQGDLQTALDDPFSVVITDETALRYFGNTDPIGKFLHSENRFDLMVTAVIRKMPANTHVQFDFLGSTKIADNLYYQGYLEQWDQISLWSYVLLGENADRDQLESKFPSFLRKYFADYIDLTTESWSDAFLQEFSLQKFQNVHLYSYYGDNFDPENDTTYTYYYVLTGIIILLIVNINYVNLSTARSITRAKEIGIRRSLGAFRFQIVRQFLSESVFLSVVSFPIALITANIFLPEFNVLTGKVLDFSVLMHPVFIFSLLFMTIFLGVAAGTYPALFFASGSAIKNLKDKLPGSTKGRGIQNVLVTVQFSVSAILLALTLVIVDQMQFIKQKDLGFNQENILILEISQAKQDIDNKLNTIKQELLQFSEVSSVSLSSNLPIINPPSTTVYNKGLSGFESFTWNFITTDNDFINTLKIDLSKGRNFTIARPSDSRAFIINEAAVRQLGWENPIGKTLYWKRTDRPGEVIGVVKDFDIHSIHHQLEPIVLRLGEPAEFIQVRLITKNMTSAMESIQTRLSAIAPDISFRYSFLDEDIIKMYENTENALRNVTNFSILAMTITCLGLLGLARFAAEQRQKEIGIRKVLGASDEKIVFMLAKKMFFTVLLANVLAMPVSYYAAKAFMQDFAYGIDLTISHYFLTMIFTASLAFGTVVFVSAKVAMANPGNTLRSQ